jgi:hypothetical protein
MGLAGRLLLAGSMCLAGCDLTGQYEARFQQALATSAQRAQFDQLLYPAGEEIKDTAGQPVGVSLRIPTLFDSSSKTLKPSDPQAQPPLPLPGLSYTRERPVNDDANKFLPVYAYFAAVPKSEQKADSVQVALQQQAAALAPGAAWTDATLKTPEGQTVTFKRLRIEGTQEFFSAQTKAAEKTAGRLDIYLVDSPTHHVLIGWRAPKAQGDKYQFTAASEAAMGTVSVVAAAPAADGGAAPKGG